MMCKSFKWIKTIEGFEFSKAQENCVTYVINEGTENMSGMCCKVLLGLLMFQENAWDL